MECSISVIDSKLSFSFSCCDNMASFSVRNSMKNVFTTHGEEKLIL